MSETLVVGHRRDSSLMTTLLSTKVFKTTRKRERVSDGTINPSDVRTCEPKRNEKKKLENFFFGRKLVVALI